MLRDLQFTSAGPERPAARHPEPRVFGPGARHERFVLLGHFRLELERSRRLLNLGRAASPGVPRLLRLSGQQAPGFAGYFRLFVSARADRDLLLLKN